MHFCVNVIGKYCIIIKRPYRYSLELLIQLLNVWFKFSIDFAINTKFASLFIIWRTYDISNDIGYNDLIR